MKKVFALVIALFLAASFAPAFAQSYQKSNNLLNAGIGLSAYGAGGLPIGISFEKGITDQISVGALPISRATVTTPVAISGTTRSFTQELVVLTTLANC